MNTVVSIIGRSKSGKTTLIEKLIKELNSRGYRVATVKHAPQGADFDHPGKDSQRHIEAGSDMTALSSPDNLAIMKRVSQDTPLEEIVRLLGEEYDIILTEGFKQGNAPKIEVHRKTAGEPLEDIKKLMAIVTDEALKTETKQYSFEDIPALADLLEKSFIGPQQERISLYVNRMPIPLTSFPRDIIREVILAMASRLRGVGEIDSLQIFLKKHRPK